MFYYALRPFLGASALYFDICKDIVFAILIHESLTALVGNESLSTHPFEAGLIYVLIFSIIVVQVSFYPLLNFLYFYAISVIKQTTLCRSMYMCDFKIYFLQVLFMILSAMSTPRVFNLCEHVSEKYPKRRFLVIFFLSK